MLFSSIVFIFYFFPVFIGAYLALGMRIALLLTGSIIFYTWGEGPYIFLLVALILVNFLAARWMSLKQGRARGMVLFFALFLDFTVLGIFKYADFFSVNLNNIFSFLNLPLFHLRLPLGVSFFTFQLVSYLIDVYRKDISFESDLFRFATYILMFPHLIAGPIVRYSAIKEELHGRVFSRDKFGLGIQYFITGLCQKVLIANSLAPVADYVFLQSTDGLSGSAAWIGLFAYTLQIYFDFCGYSNMAIGLAFMLGFTFPRNFDYPYAAQSISDFWRRWHISLSFWFRDYVYIPLGGNKGTKFKTLCNLILVFLLTGLWHGSAWNFVVWGLFHGIFLLLERLGVGRFLVRIPVAARSFYTLMVVMTGWVFFRVQDMAHAAGYLKALARPTYLSDTEIGLRILLSPEVIAAFVFGALLAWPVLPAVFDKIGIKRLGRSQFIEGRLDTLNVHPLPLVLLLTGFILSCALLVGSSLNPFLYFRF